MPFDPTKPFTVESGGGFDPNKPFTVEPSPREKQLAQELAQNTPAGMALPEFQGENISQQGRNTRNFLGPIYRDTVQMFKQAVENPTPENVLPAAAATMPLGTPAAGTGRVLAAIRKSPDTLAREAAQVNIGVTSIPGAAYSGDIGQATAQGLSAAPFGGGKLRQNARAATEQLKAAGERAFGMPTEGVPVTQDYAGARVRSALEDQSTRPFSPLTPALRPEDLLGTLTPNAQQAAEAALTRRDAPNFAFMPESKTPVFSKDSRSFAFLPDNPIAAGKPDIRDAPNFSFIPEAMSGGAKPITKSVGVVPPTEFPGATAITPGMSVLPDMRKLKGLENLSNEDIIGRLARMSTDIKTGADINNFRNALKVIPEGDRPAVQSAIIQRHGTGSDGTFDPATWVKNYEGMSNEAKSALYGAGGKGTLRQYLDDITLLSKDAPRWEQFAQKRSALGTALGVGAGVTLLSGTVAQALYGDPAGGVLNALKVVVPAAVVGRALAKPAMAASIGTWGRALRAFTTEVGNPRAIAQFKLATKSLGDNLGVPLKAEDFTQQPITMGPGDL